MREITATVYETSSGVRFIKAKSGGFIPLINPDEIDMKVRGSKRRLSNWPGIDRGIIIAGYAELTDYLRNK